MIGEEDWRRWWDQRREADVVSVLPAVQWRSVNQPHADTFKCQCGAAGTCISNNMLAACVQFPSSCGSQLSLKPILGKSKRKPRWFDPAINKRQINLLLKAPASYLTFVLYSKLFYQILGRFSKTQETNLRDKKKAFVLNIHHHCLLTFSWQFVRGNFFPLWSHFEKLQK